MKARGCRRPSFSKSPIFESHSSSLRFAESLDFWARQLRVNCGPSSIPALDREVAPPPDLLSSPWNGRSDPFPTCAPWVVAGTRPLHTRAAILDVHGGFYCRRLLVEPHIFHTPAIVHAVDHNGQPLYLRLPTGCCAEVINDWPCPLLLQLMVDFPY
jgi:hypothetical protein